MTDGGDEKKLTLAESIRERVAGAVGQPAQAQGAAQVGSGVNVDSSIYDIDPALQNWEPLKPETEVGMYKVVNGPIKGLNIDFYLAKHRMLGMPVALRFLCLESVRSATERQAFLDEVKIQSALSDPHTAKILDYVTEPSGRIFMVEEFIDGIPIIRFIDENKPTQLELLFVLFTQICDSLSKLHERGFAYLGVKPSHFKVKPFGDKKKGAEPTAESDDTQVMTPLVKIIDFNRVQEFGQYKTRESDVERLFARCPYPSPEQLNNEVVDRRSDVYSLGCLLYQLVSKDEPFAGEKAETKRESHLHKLPTSILAECNEIAGAKGAVLDGIIQKAMSKIPADRYQSLEEMAIAMSALSASK